MISLSKDFTFFWHVCLYLQFYVYAIAAYTSKWAHIQLHSSQEPFEKLPTCVYVPPPAISTLVCDEWGYTLQEI
jgi:hypothetical protein